jgi:hypothetical protein
MTRTTRKATFAAVLAAAAIMAPSAGAMPIDEHMPAIVEVPAAVNGGLGPTGGAEAQHAGAVHATQATSSNGFDWGDAGIGAAGMLTLIGLGAGAAAINRRGEHGDAVTG